MTIGTEKVYSNIVNINTRSVSIVLRLLVAAKGLFLFHMECSINLHKSQEKTQHIEQMCKKLQHLDFRLIKVLFKGIFYSNILFITSLALISLFFRKWL